MRASIPSLAHRYRSILLLSMLAAPCPLAVSQTAPPPPLPPSEACAPEQAVAGPAFQKLLAAATPPDQAPILSRYRYLPVQTEAEICLVRPWIPGARYRVFLGDGKTMRLVFPGSVWAESVVEGSTVSNACNGSDKSAKTLIHFTPAPSGEGVDWHPTQVHVLACNAANAALAVGQYRTWLTDKMTCRYIALALCVLFYLLAACASYRVHVEGRYRKELTKAQLKAMTGTNYASVWRHLDPVVLTANQNGKGSATKMQIMFFSVLIFGVVAYILMATGTLTGLSATILSLMGISGIGATAAAATEVSRKRLSFENYAWLIKRLWLPDGGSAEVVPAQWKDLFMTNNEFDVSRFQMIIFTVLVGLSLLTAGGATADLSEFSIPEAFLGILGLSQAVYVAGKLVDGPSIADLDKKIDELRGAEAALQMALASSAGKAGMSDVHGLPIDRSDLSLRVGNAYDNYIDIWESTSKMFESTLSKTVSAAAKGVRPPFPYLSLPADALAVVERKYQEFTQKIKERADNLSNKTLTDDDEDMTQKLEAASIQLSDAIKSTRKALESLQTAQRSAASAGADPIAEYEKAVRDELAKLRKQLSEFERLFAPPP